MIPINIKLERNKVVNMITPKENIKKYLQMYVINFKDMQKTLNSLVGH